MKFLNAYCWPIPVLHVCSDSGRIRHRICQQAVGRLFFTLNIHAACAHPLTKHERQHRRIILKHHQQCHTPEKADGFAGCLQGA
ncbi:hypothetical protein ACFS07_06270 [Undibacterium arcticum]